MEADEQGTRRYSADPDGRLLRDGVAVPEGEEPSWFHERGLDEMEAGAKAQRQSSRELAARLVGLTRPEAEALIADQAGVRLVFDTTGPSSAGPSWSGRIRARVRGGRIVSTRVG